MNERLTELKRKTRNGYFKQYRKDISIDIEQESIKLNLSWPKRAAHSLRRMCEEQTPVVLPDERIVFTRTVNKCPEVPIPTEITRQAERDNYHVGNGAANICSDWQMILAEGLHGRKKAALESRKRIAANYNDVSREIRDRDETIEFLDAAIESIDTVLALAYRYSEEARRNGRDDMADILTDWKDHKYITLLNPMYDLTPKEFIDMVITDVGTVPASSVPVIIRYVNSNLFYYY